MPKKSTHYGENYFSKFETNSRIKQWLLNFVDKHGAVIPFLKKHFSRNSVLIDFACGNGLFLKYASRFFNCVGVDFSKSAIMLARKTAPQAKFITGSLDVLKDRYADNSVDIVTCFAMMEHLSDHEHYLHEFWRILKPSGFFIMSVPITDSIALRKRKQKWIVFEDSSHVRIYSREGWTQLLNRHGLLVTKIWSDGIMNSPTPGFSLPFNMLPIHYVTQGLGLLGIKLPAQFSDLDYFVAIKNPHYHN